MTEARFMDLVKDIYECGRDDGYDLHIHDASGNYPDGLDREPYMAQQQADQLEQFCKRYAREIGSLEN